MVTYVFITVMVLAVYYFVFLFACRLIEGWWFWRWPIEMFKDFFSLILWRT